jgi:formamidopyrimidine-DNA glycosylase
MGVATVVDELSATDESLAVLRHPVGFDPQGQPDHGTANGDRRKEAEQFHDTTSVPHQSNVGHTRGVPEGLEVEIYRRAAMPLVGRTIVGMDVDDRVAGPGVVEVAAGVLIGATVLGVGRIGKLLLVETEDMTIGVHFGMTGRIVVDRVAPIGQLEYGSGRDRPEWDRLRIDFAGGGSVRVNDPRRWARVTLDPDTSTFGPDVLALDVAELRGAVRGRARSIKSVLLDQHLIAGLGNLCADEVLWHAGLAPTKDAGGLTEREIGALHRSITTRLPEMLRLGGSHRGTVSPELRRAMPVCPVDGASLRRDQVAGRTTVWCPLHQT